MTLSVIPPAIALVDADKAIATSELDAIAHAIAIQIDRDLAPAWGVTAPVVTIPAGGMLHGAWPIYIKNHARDLGIHLDENHQPYSVVRRTTDYPLTISHEALEMIVDPWGNRLVHGKAPDGKPAYLLVEVCDPCEGFSYDINGVPVSDFVLPAYYRTRRHGPFDFMGEITASREVAEGGYLSWRADHAWHQRTWFQGNTAIDTILGRRFDARVTEERSLRAAIDAHVRSNDPGDERA